MRVLENVEDVFLAFIGFPSSERVGRLLCRFAKGFGERNLQHRPARKNHCTLDQIFELTDISGPMVIRERRHSFAGNRVHVALHLPRILLGEVTHQHGNIFAALPQRRHLYRKNIQTVEQIAAKFPVRHHLHQITNGGRDEPDIYFSCARSTQSPLEFLFLQYPKKLRLKFQRDIADFVQEKRAPVRQLESADLLRDGPGESSALVTEELFDSKSPVGMAAQFIFTKVRSRRPLMS